MEAAIKAVAASMGAVDTHDDTSTALLGFLLGEASVARPFRPAAAPQCARQLVLKGRGGGGSHGRYGAPRHVHCRHTASARACLLVLCMCRVWARGAGQRGQRQAVQGCRGTLPCVRVYGNNPSFGLRSQAPAGPRLGASLASVPITHCS